MTKTSRNVTYEEWKDDVYKEVIESLKAFPKEEVVAFLESEEEWIKESYERDKKSGVFCSSGLEYALSMAF